MGKQRKCVSIVARVLTCILTYSSVCNAVSPSCAAAPAHIDFPNHNLHNFYVTAETYEHAVAMGYRLVPYSDKVKRQSRPEFRRLNLIRNHNAHICPLRIHLRKADQKLHVTYHKHAGVAPGGMNPIAQANGLRRSVSGPPREMTGQDLQILKGYGAARRQVTDLTRDNITYDEIQKRFHTSWPLENEHFQSCNVLCNWQSKKVVHDMIAATIENTDWDQYDALFFDSLSGAARKTANAGFGGAGSYPTGLDGKLAFVQAIVRFARDPEKTHRAQPYLIFTNIYDPKGRTAAREWYAEDKLRCDHYYFERGSKEAGSYLTKHGYVLGTLHANGVVPGTSKPAYVATDANTTGSVETGYLPANRVALDDAYTWSMRVSKTPEFDHQAFFDQHLDACGTAGIQGSWFGWYGEDYVTIRDTRGKLIYSNACQLLRAIPNWDNMHGIPVPAWKDYKASDRRSWDGEIYRSPHSYASHKIVYSRNPDNHEIYVVFNDAEGQLQLQQGETISAAFFVNAWFTKTDEDALPALQYDDQEHSVTLKALNQLERGIRIVTNRAD